MPLITCRGEAFAGRVAASMLAAIGLPELTTDNLHEYESLARVLKSVLQRLDRALEMPPFNLIVHTSPFSVDVADAYHWHVEIMPKLTRVAGFEWGTGFYINPTSPEEAAKVLRAVRL